MIPAAADFFGTSLSPTRSSPADVATAAALDPALELDWEWDVDSGRVRRSSVLLAEWHRELRALLAFVLRRDGHHVVGAADGAEILEALAVRCGIDRYEAGPLRAFDLILSAHDMPGIPGLAVLAGLRARGQTTPFVLMTPDPCVQAHARRLGAVILDRPLSIGTIRRSLHQAFEVARRCEVLAASGAARSPS